MAWKKRRGSTHLWLYVMLFKQNWKDTSIILNAEKRQEVDLPTYRHASLILN